MTAAPAVAEAASDPTAALVRAQRQEWDARERALIMGFIPDGRFRADDPAVVALRTVSRGFTGINAIHAFRHLPPEEQAHPAVQAALQDIGRALGAAVLRCRDLLEGFLQGDRPDDYVQLHGALRVLRLSSRSWGLRPERRSMLTEAFDLAEAPSRPLSRRRLERMLRRIERLEALVDRAGNDAGELLERPTAQVSAAASAGAARHGLTPVPVAAQSTAAKIGYILLGLVLTAGGVLVAVWGICEVGCGNPAGALLILLGLAMIGLAFWSFTRVGDRVNRSLTPSKPDPAPMLDALDEEDLPEGPCVNIFARDGWTLAPVERSPSGPVRLVARGRVHGPWGWLASANGDGVAAGPDAPMPGMPEVSLIARVGGELLFLGATGAVPAGPAAPIELRLNIGPLGDDDTVSGYFHVCRA